MDLDPETEINQHPDRWPYDSSCCLEFNSIFNQNDPARIPNFQASEGWLRCFRKRHSIKFKSLSDEDFDAPVELAEEYKQKLVNIC